MLVDMATSGSHPLTPHQRVLLEKCGESALKMLSSAWSVPYHPVSPSPLLSNLCDCLIHRHPPPYLQPMGWGNSQSSGCPSSWPSPLAAQEKTPPPQSNALSGAANRQGYVSPASHPIPSPPPTPRTDMGRGGGNGSPLPNASQMDSRFTSGGLTPQKVLKMGAFEASLS